MIRQDFGWTLIIPSDTVSPCRMERIIRPCAIGVDIQHVEKLRTQVPHIILEFQGQAAFEISKMVSDARLERGIIACLYTKELAIYVAVLTVDRASIEELEQHLTEQEVEETNIQVQGLEKITACGGIILDEGRKKMFHDCMEQVGFFNIQFREKTKAQPRIIWSILLDNFYGYLPKLLGVKLFPE